MKERAHMNVNVGKHLCISHISFGIRNLMQARKHMKVNRVLTQGENFMTVEKLSVQKQPSQFIKDFAQEKNVTNVAHVGWPFVRS